MIKSYRKIGKNMNILRKNNFISNGIALAGGHSGVAVVSYNDKLFALKGPSCTVFEECLKYDFLKMLGVAIPTSIFLVVGDDGYYVATEIMPGFAPMGHLKLSSFSAIDFKSYPHLPDGYVSWSNKFNLPIYAETMSLYQRCVDEQLTLPIRGIENLFAAAVFIDDDVPCGKTEL
jgi:hypothetical protein